MQEMSTKTQVEWRRNQVFELSSKGHSQLEIAKTLQISDSTISRDLDYLKQQSSSRLQHWQTLVFH
jgi:DNA-binding NarL/FixJ family response regulator